MKPVMISLYDLTGVMAEPWLAAGYECWIVDIQHAPGVHADPERPGLFKVGADLRSGWLPPAELVGRIAFVAAFPPCDHLSVSGARWFKGKGLRKLALAVDLFATATEICEWTGAPYCIENPVSTISTYWRKPDATFHPHDFTGFALEDNYTKKTCLWVGGGFVMPQPHKASGLPEPDATRIHHVPPGAERANIRSATPRGFSRAVFEKNRRFDMEAAA